VEEEEEEVASVFDSFHHQILLVLHHLSYSELMIQKDLNVLELMRKKKWRVVLDVLVMKEEGLKKMAE
jgi:hypothetical protein